MNNLISFINMFLSYMLVFVVIVILCAIAIAIGITLRKKKDAKEALLAATESDEEVVESTKEA